MSESGPSQAAGETIAPQAPVGKRLIWDVPTRLFHWLLVASIIASWATAELSSTLMQVHLWLGYWTMGLIVFRLVWGLIGSRHARFWSFLKGPLTVLRYARSMMSPAHQETAGHNPMGGWMVMILLVLIARQVYSGLFANDDVMWEGPWSHTVSHASQKGLTALHHQNFLLIEIAVALHILAIVWYRLAMRTDLVTPMVTGRKSDVAEGKAIKGTPWLRAALAIALAGAAVWAVIYLAPPPPAEDF